MPRTRRVAPFGADGAAGGVATYPSQWDIWPSTAPDAVSSPYSGARTLPPLGFTLTLPPPRRLLLGLGLALLLALAALWSFGAAQSWQALQRVTLGPGSGAIDQQIQPWMTLGYLAVRYHVPREALAVQLGVSPAERLTVGEIARLQHVSDQQEEQDAAAAIASLQSSSASPGPQAPLDRPPRGTDNTQSSGALEPREPLSASLARVQTPWVGAGA